jgi:hypothetical protein
LAKTSGAKNWRKLWRISEALDRRFVLVIVPDRSSRLSEYEIENGASGLLVLDINHVGGLTGLFHGLDQFLDPCQHVVLVTGWNGPGLADGFPLPDVLVFVNNLDLSGVLFSCG